MKNITSLLTPQFATLKSVSVLAALLLFHAAPGSAACVSDGSFATDGIGANDTVYAIGVQSNGKIVLGGSFTHINGAPRPRFAILNANGTLDPYFYNNPNNTIRAIAIQPDGKILVGGDFTSIYGGFKPYLGRILAAYGTTDTLTVSNLNGSVHAIALQPDGKILIGGSFTSPKSGIARLNSDGTVDTTFNPGTGTDNGTVYAIAVNNISGSGNYGKIYIAGNFYKYAGTDRVRIARLNSNGSLDTTFAAPAPNNNVYALALQWIESQEKVLIGGAFTGDSFFTSGRFCRIDASGSVDHPFNYNIAPIDGEVRSIVVQSDLSILIGGAFTQTGIYARRGIARFDGYGHLDTAWEPCDGATNPGIIRTIAMQPTGYGYTGGILVGGNFTHFEANQHWNYGRLNF